MNKESRGLNDKKTINAWAFFDWANSAYALIITVAIFPVYFNNVVDDEFMLWGLKLTDSNAFSYSISFAYLLIALALPMLGGIADFSGKRLIFMRGFTILGSFSCISLFFFDEHALVAFGLICFMLATIGFAGGQAFNNAFLPMIVSEDKVDQVSAKGYAYGFIGSVILLILIIIALLLYNKYAYEDPGAPKYWVDRISFVVVGLWWLGFSQITFNNMPKEEKSKRYRNLFFKGYKETSKVFKKLKSDSNISKFLISFFFLSAGIQTVMFLASTFAVDELAFEATEMILLIILLQILAIGGAYLFSYLSDKWGNRNCLLFQMLVWIFICVASYFTYTKLGFYGIAALVGLVMGGTQSLARASFSKLIPDSSNSSASYFSFYDLLEKSAIVIGTFSFGLIETMTGGMRNSILFLVLFFILSIGLIATVVIGKKES